MVSMRASARGALNVVFLLAGLSGLAWGGLSAKDSAISDDFVAVEARLLRFETFTPGAANRALQLAQANPVSACDSHAQHTLLLLEIPLLDAALRAGAVKEFDQRMAAMEERTRLTLSCAPRDSFAWLVAFGLALGHGHLDDSAFALLAQSYQTGPNEAWIAVRRTILASPVITRAPDGVKAEILDEFGTLVRRGFVDVVAKAYVSAPSQAQALLKSRIDQLDSRAQTSFAKAVESLRRS
ncbi:MULTISPECIES: hypothetical protein [Bradyrhizobium]|jgi:hypothetical protein|uniref:hypothetical protein n=1 Tax=Bradyrhizobium TaxID=374 RepID=UPI00005DC80E|nr:MULTISPECIES: hypothetical protein [Bradyrhizobium]MCL8485495.1 hypothetical protein [Bradyrhizobium denitrificans]RTM05553.1 MAG: hypothetical protein EKK32_03075 [Bradyrhizobiaceae bacterium]